MPKLTAHMSKELTRCNLTDVITLMESCFKLWNKHAFSKAVPIKSVFSNCNAYLSEFLGKSKKDITGS